MYPSLPISPPSYTNTASQSVVKGMFPQDKQTVIQNLLQLLSKVVTADIYHISTWFCGQEIFAFYMSLDYTALHSDMHRLCIPLGYSVCNSKKQV